jgi:inosine-uridine nucleoside N-ribohydrolase
MRMKKIPVILDTDIGSDIDDTWALAMALRSPELDIRLVVTDTRDTARRARIAARLLHAAARTDVPIGIGIPLANGVLYQAPWGDEYALSDYPGRVFEDGVGAIIDTIMSSPEPVTLVAIGPLPNIAAALQREPRIVEHARFVGMYGSIKRGYDGSLQPSPEFNVAAYPFSCRKVFTAPWEITITPLDTCGLVRLTGDDYRKVRRSEDPLLRALMENYRVWLDNNPKAQHLDFETQSSTLHDTVAVYLAFADDLLVMQDMGIRITDDGYTVVDDAAKHVRCAIAWRDLDAYHALLAHRLAG